MTEETSLTSASMLSMYKPSLGSYENKLKEECWEHSIFNIHSNNYSLIRWNPYGFHHFMRDSFPKCGIHIDFTP